MAFELQFRVPPPALREILAFDYVLRSDAGVVEDQLNALLPQFHWIAEGAFFYDDADGVLQPCPRTAIVGMSMRAPRIRVAGPATIVGVGFLPRGWVQTTGLPAALCTDSIQPGELAAPDLAAGFALLDPRRSADELIELAFGLIARNLMPPEPGLARTIAAIDLWLVNNGRDVDLLADRTGISHRQLNRVVLRTHGASLKSLGTKFRTLRVASRLATGEATHWSAAVADEFYDQPHLIRNFRRFIGTTPHAFVSPDGSLNRSIMRQRLALRPDNALAGWS
ncbi:AraC family transcriptional regulator [Qipengyuania spongiae]|uniref:Helix-turn-helix domain-containing protein n=1 Tax=Qipengyuania spongiae TaxID=2909673 RepID=A0ABY5T3L2_9SPHN|nr:helix-turn-helix domain-containing protein [Qipengyuania spongiae]UVI39574.1 helix-turn-helix domain-containing protein [Qipengyuania spongiae]